MCPLHSTPMHSALYFYTLCPLPFAVCPLPSAICCLPSTRCSYVRYKFSTYCSPLCWPGPRYRTVRYNEVIVDIASQVNSQTFIFPLPLYGPTLDIFAYTSRHQTLRQGIFVCFYRDCLTHLPAPRPSHIFSSLMLLCICFFAIPLFDGCIACVYVAMCSRMMDDVDKRQKLRNAIYFF